MPGDDAKTVSREFRAGNPPPRVSEVEGGMINSIGLPTKGIEYFLSHQVPDYKRFTPPPLVWETLTGLKDIDYVLAKLRWMREMRIWPNGLRYLWTDAFGVVLHGRPRLDACAQRASGGPALAHRPASTGAGGRPCGRGLDRRAPAPSARGEARGFDGGGVVKEKF